MSIRVVVADDQAAVREGLVLLLDLLDDVTVVGAAGDGEQTLALVAEHHPDVVLMDLRMPRGDGVATTARLHADFPATRVVVLTTFADDEHILAALRAGALGYLTKDAGRAQIAQAIRTAAGGQSVLDPVVRQRLLAAVTDPGPTDPAGAPPRPAPHGLTERELEVLRLIATGLSNRQIAGRLYVTEATVKSHVNRLFAKTGVRDRAQAVRYAYDHGLVD
ncbi:response regulator [Micromonospora mirobrigensis]|uniref:Two component transcriptional regulator, LuxR family n=1 Tax=Micromonospora mirobrigensis TaxID=262898 RepID=A0A1C5ALQ8_9ACTN|nr:response regulator transcription factor [Micromonospora mirobrigensis]SCF46139.1 two component transcriptional regulator, LuxR family [Micromonospora mirobrigensis]